MNSQLDPQARRIRRLICATDLRPRSDLAIRRAALLAARTGAKLSLVHAIDARQPERALRARINRAYVALLWKVDEIFGPAAASIDVIVRAGRRPLDVIAQTAAECNADAIVIAAPQPRRLDPFVGTTAERLIRATKRPVLVVHHEARAQYRNVALATDLSEAAGRMIQTVADLGISVDADTTVLHAFSAPYDGMMRAVGVDDHEIDRYRQGWAEDADAKLDELLDAAGFSRDRTRILVERNVPQPAIRSLVKEVRPELLIIGASRWFLLKRTLLGSVADDVLRTATCDVLVIPPRPARAKSESAQRMASRRFGVPSQGAPGAS